jgi:tetratricopeptide (TPR) repeat protein
VRSPAFVLIALAPLLFGFKPFERRNSEVEQGNAALQAGKAEDALAHYDKAVAKLPGEAGVHLDRGTALYALSRFDEARQEFLNATQGPDQAVKATAFRNLGNALSKLEKHKDAVEAYKHALALRPDDKAAKWNLEIALRKQKEEEKKKQDDKDKNKDDKDKDKKDDKDKDKDKKDKQDDKKDDKDKDKKDKQDKQDKKDQNEKDKQEKQPQPEKAEQNQPERIQEMLKNLEANPKDLEKERARLRAVRRGPPARDW